MNFPIIDHPATEWNIENVSMVIALTGIYLILLLLKKARS